MNLVTLRDCRVSTLDTSLTLTKTVTVKQQEVEECLEEEDIHRIWCSLTSGSNVQLGDFEPSSRRLRVS